MMIFVDRPRALPPRSWLLVVLLRVDRDSSGWATRTLREYLEHIGYCAARDGGCGHVLGVSTEFMRQGIATIICLTTSKNRTAPLPGGAGGQLELHFKYLHSSRRVPTSKFLSAI